MRAHTQTCERVNTHTGTERRDILGLRHTHTHTQVCTSIYTQTPDSHVGAHEAFISSQVLFKVHSYFQDARKRKRLKTIYSDIAVRFLLA